MKSGTFNVWCPCKPGLVKEVDTEIARYKLDFAMVEEFRLNLVGGERTVDFLCSFEKGNES